MQPLEMTPILIPAALLKEAGIIPESVLQGEVIDGKLVIQVARPNSEEFDCDGECDECPFYKPEKDYCPVFDEYINLSEGGKDNE